MLSIFDLAALLLTLSALFGWINTRFLGLPHSIGMLIMGLASSLSLIAAEIAFPDIALFHQLEATLRGIDFTDPDGYENAREPLFWFEGTGQLVCGLGQLAKYYHDLGDEERAARYARMAAKYTEDMHRFSEYYELEGALPYMAIRPPIDQIVKLLEAGVEQ